MNRKHWPLVGGGLVIVLVLLSYTTPSAPPPFSFLDCPSDQQGQVTCILVLRTTERTVVRTIQHSISYRTVYSTGTHYWVLTSTSVQGTETHYFITQGTSSVGVKPVSTKTFLPVQTSTKVGNFLYSLPFAIVSLQWIVAVGILSWKPIGTACRSWETKEIVIGVKLIVQATENMKANSIYSWMWGEASGFGSIRKGKIGSFLGGLDLIPTTGIDLDKGELFQFGALGLAEQVIKDARRVVYGLYPSPMLPFYQGWMFVPPPFVEFSLPISEDC